MFERTFKEGMSLVEETAAYLDGPGRAASKRLPRIAALAYASESMRLTTRLMQVASWLLVQRALREGQMRIEEAGQEKYRLASRHAPPFAPASGAEETPEALRALAARASALHERVRRLDQDMYGEADARNAPADQLEQIRAAFSGK